jgi:hypothetical protein
MSVINSQPLIGASGNQGGAYNLTRSLRFRSSASARLSRTPSSTGDRQKFTWSGWIKRGTLSSSTDYVLFDAQTDANNWFTFWIRNDSIGYDVSWTSTANRIITISNAVYRDVSSWYHVIVSVDTTQATGSNRIRIYINNAEITAFSYPTGSGFIAQNTNMSINLASTPHSIGGRNTGTPDKFYDGYMAEVNFVDSQQLTPSSFGETSTTTGVWIPKKYTGTYGTNGFYLDFEDTSSTAALGYDAAGSNDWTVNNVSLTSGATYDSMTDVPTLTSATAANYCVLNPLINSNGVLSNGNLTYAGTAAGNKPVTLTGGFKQYAEITIGSGTASVFGLATATADMTQNTGLTTNGLYGIYDNTSGFYLFSNGTTITNISGQTSAGVVFQLAYDAPNGKLWIGKNNTWYNSSLGTTGNPSAGTNETLSSLPTDLRMFVGTGNFSTTYNVNFGQQPFAYTPPTGFVALNTFNLPTPTIGATASTQANDYFDATTYTGNGSTQTITNAGGFSPDLIWIKSRSNAYNNFLTDSVRGASKYLISNATDAEADAGSAGITAFNSNGFSMGSGTALNANAATYVGWQWRGSDSSAVSNTAGSITSTVSANTSAGFSVVSWTGTGSGAATVGHGLGVAPKFIITKPRGITADWICYSENLGNNAYLVLNSTAAQVTGATTVWGSTSPTSTVFSLGSGYNYSTTMVAYCFAEVAGYSKFGSYVGNGSADGAFVYTGFRPKFVMFKRLDGVVGWGMIDSARNTFNFSNDLLEPNTSNATQAYSDLGFDFVSNGFKVRGASGNTNASGGTYIYMAFAESPFKYSLAR